MEITTTREGNMNYRVNLISRLNNRAIELQNEGRFKEADDLLILALRWEAVWASQDAV